MKEPDEAHAIVQPHQAFQNDVKHGYGRVPIRSIDSAAINFSSKQYGKNQPSDLRLAGAGRYVGCSRSACGFQSFSICTTATSAALGGRFRRRSNHTCSFQNSSPARDASLAEAFGGTGIENVLGSLAIWSLQLSKVYINRFITAAEVGPTGADQLTALLRLLCS